MDLSQNKSAIAKGMDIGRSGTNNGGSGGFAEPTESFLLEYLTTSNDSLFSENGFTSLTTKNNMSNYDLLTHTGHDTFSHLQIDQLFMTIYFLNLSISAILLNAVVIYLTRKYKQFHEAYMYVRAGYSCFDIAFALSSVLHYVTHVNIDGIPLWVSCVSSDYRIGTFFGTIQLTAFIALERYFFFCRPYVYQRYFTLKSTVSVVIAIFLITQGYSFGTEIIFGRVFQPLLSMCVFENQSRHNLVQILVFFLPAMICTCFSVFKILKLMRSVGNAAGNAGEAMAGHPAGVSEFALRRKAAKKALR